MIAPDSQSYPFLGIAQQHNVDYGLVLNLATIVDIELDAVHPPAWMVDCSELLTAVKSACTRERRRREAVRKTAALATTRG